MWNTKVTPPRSLSYLMIHKTQASILLVDDRPDNLFVMEAVLADMDARLVQARSGSEALRHVLATDFSVILMDVRMPDMDGIEAALLIKERVTSRTIPIIFVTAEDDTADDRRRGYAAGAADFIHKPIVPEVLKAKVAIFLELDRKNRELQDEVERRRAVEVALREASEALEGRVARRTAALSAANAALKAEIAERKAAEAALIERERLVSLVADVGRAVSSESDIQEVLQIGVDLIVERLDAADVQIWTLSEDLSLLELEVRSGFCVPLNNSQTQTWVGEDVIASILASRKPHLTNTAAEDPRVSDQEWIRRAGMGAFAGYPMVVGEHLVGVLALFSRHELHRSAFVALGSVANELANAIERDRLHLELLNRVEELALADRHKDDFLAMLGHELRTPLATMRNAFHLLRRRSSDDEGILKSCNTLERQVAHMARLVQDLQDLSRIRQGKIQLQKTPVDIHTLAAQVAENVKPQMSEKGHTLLLELESEPVIISADSGRIQQVISNLLTNAAKYTDAGGRISLGIRRDGEMVLLKVRDTGIGIEPARLPHVFDLYMQVDGSVVRAQGGIGVGLSVVRSLVELHGGTVTAHSAGITHGSEFVVSLPVSG